MSKFKAKSNIKHDGKNFKKGQEIELSDEVAAPLLADGVIVTPDNNDEVEESDRPQPAVNKASREGDSADAPTKVEAGKVEQRQPGDGEDAPVETGDKTETETKTEEAPEKKEGFLGKILGSKDTKEEDNGDNL